VFKEPKAAQVAAYFLHRAGGAMPRAKLVKLMYLADRHHYCERGFPITDDDAVAMEFGPVLSKTLGLVNGDLRPSASWDGLISGKEGKDGHEAALRRPIGGNDLDELSEAEERTLEAVFGRFGQCGEWELSDYTHTLGEWIQCGAAGAQGSGPGDGRAPISPRDILTALGKSPDEIEASLRYIEECREMDAALALGAPLGSRN
jgi:uncharacterized phage-associated protein